MKYLFFVCAMYITTLAICQPAGTYAAFRAQKKTIVLNTGITMKYIDTGNAKGTPVILLHGATDTGRSYLPTIEELIKINSNLRIIVPDLRGHGESSMPEKNRCAEAPEHCFTPAVFASDIIALMNQLNIAKTYIVGHSMGSIIAQELAIHHADRVISQVLIGTFVNGKESHILHEFLIKGFLEEKMKAAFEKLGNLQWPADAYTVTTAELGPEITQFLKDNWVTELATDETYLNDIFQETIQVPVGTWIGVMTTLGKMDNRTLLKNLKVATLVLYPSQDMMFPEGDQAQIKAVLEKAASQHGTRIIYKTYGKIPLPASGIQENDLGHNLQWAAYKQVAADIVSFIKNGYPVSNIPYINPQNPREVLTDTSQANLIDFQKK